MKKYGIFGSVAIVIIALVLLVIFLKPAPEISMRTARVETGTLAMTVTASGYIQPVLQVEVGTQVSGIVERLFVDYNSEVTKGQLLAQLDKSTLREKVLQSQAQCDDAQSNLHLAQQNYDRTKSLYDNKAATQTELEEVENRLATAKNAVTNTKANLQQAKVNLSYADIYSPISGRVLNRAVDEGQTVAATFNTPTLFTIANDLKKMQVEADVDEADIGQIEIGQSVQFGVDTYPGEIFIGTVQQIRLNPTVSANVVTYVVIIEAPNPNEKLFPGMTANVTILTESANGLLVPTEAFYFNPDPKIFADYEIEGSRSEKQDQVYVLKGKHIECRKVSAGASDGVQSMILNGVKEGDTILLSAQQITDKKEAVSLAPKGAH